MAGFFNYDNPVWRFIGKFADLLLLNILWWVCSIPIFTIGASTTAVYYVTLKLVRDEDGYTIKSFFKSFKENFKQSTIIWLILLVVGVLLGIDLFFFLRIWVTPSTFRTILFTIFLSISLVYLAIATYVFPIQSRFCNPVKKTLFNAFFMSIRHFFHTIGILAIDIGLFWFSVYLVPQLFMVFVLFGFPLIAFINSFIFAGIFAKYMPEKDHSDEELRPLFEEEDAAAPLMMEDNSNKKEGVQEMGTDRREED